MNNEDLIEALDDFQSRVNYHHVQLNKFIERNNYCDTIKQAEEIIKASYACMLLRYYEGFAASVDKSVKNIGESNIVQILMNKEREISNQFKDCIDEIMQTDMEPEQVKKYLKDRIESIRNSLDSMEELIAEKCENK